MERLSLWLVSIVISPQFLDGTNYCFVQPPLSESHDLDQYESLAYLRLTRVWIDRLVNKDNKSIIQAMARIRISSLSISYMNFQHLVGMGYKWNTPSVV